MALPYSCPGRKGVSTAETLSRQSVSMAPGVTTTTAVLCLLTTFEHAKQFGKLSRHAEHPSSGVSENTPINCINGNVMCRCPINLPLGTPTWVLWCRDYARTDARLACCTHGAEASTHNKGKKNPKKKHKNKAKQYAP